LRSGDSIPEKSLVVTFDDGFRGVYENAFPTLRRLGMTATVFLSIGRQCSSGFPERLPSLEGRTMLNWEEIREMHGSGITFGAHTLTHPDLTRLTSDRIDEELGVSQRRIEDALGVPVKSFAYPFGLHDEQVRDLARKYFSCACTDKLGFATQGSDIFALERVDAFYLRTTRLFSLVSSRIFSWYVLSRAIPRGIRRSVAKL
jgi:peptidoglycan/xylan/chitin deacetylase (PgdA/CDA1 family)